MCREADTYPKCWISSSHLIISKYWKDNEGGCQKEVERYPWCKPVTLIP